MPFDEDADLRGDPAMRSDPTRSIRFERASRILRDIACALGIAPATFFADPPLPAPSEAADLLASTPLARCLEVLRGDVEAIARPDGEIPKLSS